MTSSDVIDLIALADTARGPVGSHADVPDGERVITYAQWESEGHDRAMLDNPEARVPTDHAATIATDVQPRLFRGDGRGGDEGEAEGRGGDQDAACGCTAQGRCLPGVGGPRPGTERAARGTGR
ncbi:hypothetical protein [Streptomyces sp. NPDC096142]|uniref:hypothetical protein n=1 Tax=Streptomyces sp. NPDC096142 TaxID=3366077 RepID=UPI00382F038A